jgi:hypothetical protein
MEAVGWASAAVAQPAEGNGGPAAPSAELDGGPAGGDAASVGGRAQPAENSIGFSQSMGSPTVAEQASQVAASKPAARMSVKDQLAARFGRTKSASEIAAEKSMELIMRLKSSVADIEKKQQQTLNSCQSLLDACGDAIAAWFKGLSGKALQRAIKEVRSWT